MTERKELDEGTARALRRAEAQRLDADDRYAKMIVAAAEAYGISAVARALGVTRQAVQARLAAAGPRAEAAEG